MSVCSLCEVFKNNLFELGNVDRIRAVRFQQLHHGSHHWKDNRGGDEYVPPKCGGEDVKLRQELVQC